MYGFSTKKGVSIIKVDEKELNNIIRLYNPKNPQERKLLIENWKIALRNERDDYNNFTMIIRDKCQKVIGLVSFETKDCQNFDIDVWIPSIGKRERYFQYVVDSIVEWVEDYTDILQISHLREVQGNPRDNKYQTLLENYDIAV